jgi:hypothetical protein
MARCSVISSSSADSSTVAVIAFNNPSGPVMLSPRARAALTSSRTAAHSASPDGMLFPAASLAGLTPTSVSVIADQPSWPTLLRSAHQARTTVQRTVPIRRAEAEL